MSLHVQKMLQYRMQWPCDLLLSNCYQLLAPIPPHPTAHFIAISECYSRSWGVGVIIPDS